MKRSLYHGTSLWGLASIVTQGRMTEGAHWGRPGEPHGVRFFENIAKAKLFSHDRDEPPPGGIIELDRSLVEKKHRLVRYHDVDATGEHWKSEGEEIVVLGKSMAFWPYLRAVYLAPGVIEELTDKKKFDEQVDWWMAVDSSGRHGLKRAFARRALSTLKEWVLSNKITEVK